MLLRPLKSSIVRVVTHVVENMKIQIWNNQTEDETMTVVQDTNTPFMYNMDFDIQRARI